ncbi:unnamed protein product, partial [Laminaria digitata]
GRDLTTNRSVVVKAFDTMSIGADEIMAGSLELLKFEIETMKRTNGHPNVVELLDVLASPSKLFIVLEYVSGKGGDLFNVIAAEGR